ncbi:MAG: hypothetical protein HY735_04820 [Verrucomicrobia bacterium]|nr:hypothetical protein [Verrucomicrobiota bacterium]
MKKNTVVPGPPPALTVLPAAITSDFFGHLELSISNLAAGATVKVERFQVNNRDGVIDTAAVLQSSYLVTDGQSPIVNRATNTAVVADATLADGVIQAQLGYLDPFVQNMAGEYVLRVSSPSGAFRPATQRLSVAPTPHPQRFSGQVRAGGGVVPFAYVGLLTATGAGGEFAGGAIADAEGRYTIQAPAGVYELMTARPGFVGDLGRSTLVRLSANTNRIVDLTLESGTRKISGRLFDRALPEQGLAGIQLFGWTADDERFTIGYSDAEGNWSLAVTPEVWRISILPQAVVAAGYVGLQDELYLDAEAEDVREVNIGLPRADRLVRGTVRDASDNSLISDCAVELWSADLDYKVRVRSDIQGQYLAPVFEGSWFQTVNPESVLELGYAGLTAITLNVSSNAVSESNLYLAPLATELSGMVVDDLGQPVPGAILLFQPVEAGNRAWTTAETDEEGRMYGAVPAGTFRASVDMPNTYYDLIEVESPPFQARLDSNPELKLLMKNPKARLKVRLVDGLGEPVTDLPLFAEARITNTVHRTFDYTDEEGVADLGVISGEWTVRFDQSNAALSLATFGYLPTTNRVVAITGTDRAIEVTLTRTPVTPSPEPPPRLTVTKASSRIRLTWPSSAGSPGFALESAPTVMGPWKMVTGSPVASGAVLTHDVDPTGPAGFFRLRRP